MLNELIFFVYECQGQLLKKICGIVLKEQPWKSGQRNEGTRDKFKEEKVSIQRLVSGHILNKGFPLGAYYLEKPGYF